MRLRTLGALAVEGADFRRSKPLLLLSYLALEGAKDSKELSQLFFPAAKKPSQSLATALGYIRKALPEVVARDKDQKLKAQLGMDASLLLSTLEAGDLETGLELYGGRFLDGIAVSDISSELEEWIYATREFIAHRVRQALLSLGEQTKDIARAAQYAERAYLLAGAPEPSPEQFQRIYTLLHKGDSHLAPEVKTEAQSFGVALEHQNDVKESEKGRNEVLVTAPSSLVSESRIKHNLPERLTSFVGRVAEVLEIKTLLLQEDTRLLTLLGTGGIGKTRLSLQLLRELLADGSSEEKQEMFTGLYFIQLETLNTQEDILNAVASALGLGLHANQDTFEQIQAYLKDKAYLLVLDNFEHLVKEARFVPTLLKACSDLTLISTSRARLNLAAELVYPMGGLELPLETDSSEQIRQRDAVKLFLERAKTADLRFSANEAVLKKAAEVCELVHGLPLGIELAAAWVKFIPVFDIKEEIQSNFDFLESTKQDAIGRHQSLRAVFEHSWQLLTKKEQGVLKQLSVFRGGFTREAAREVAGADIPTIMSLTDKSLLRVNNYRFDMHPLILQYSFEKLSAHEALKDASLEKHAQYFLALAKSHPEDFYTLAHLPLIEATQKEMDNIWAVLDYLDQHDLTDQALKLLSSLALFWRIRGYYKEASKQLHRFMTKVDRRHPDLNVAWVLNKGGLIIEYTSGFAKAKPWHEDSLTMFEHLDHKEGMASTHNNLAYIYLDDNLSLCQQHLSKALELSKEHRLSHLEAHALTILSHTEDQQDNFDTALELQHQALKLKQALGDIRGSVSSLLSLANIHINLGKYERAQELIEESMELLKHFNAPAQIGFCYEYLTDIFVTQVQYTNAKQAALQAIELYDKSNNNFALVRFIPIFTELLTKLELWQEAASLIGASQRLFETYHASLSPSQQKDFDISITEVQKALDQTLYESLVRQGQTMTVEKLVETYSALLKT